MNEHYAAVSVWLADLAEKFATLAASPAAAGLPQPTVHIHVMPAASEPTPDSAAHISQVAVALLGKPAKLRDPNGPRHGADAYFPGGSWLSVHGLVLAESSASARVAEANHRWGLAS